MPQAVISPIWINDDYIVRSIVMIWHLTFTIKGSTGNIRAFKLFFSLSFYADCYECYFGI